MCLRIEEYLRVQDAVGVCAGEVFVCQRLEVSGCDEDGYADEVVVEEVIEGGEAGIPVFEGLRRGEGGVD